MIKKFGLLGATLFAIPSAFAATGAVGGGMFELLGRVFGGLAELFTFNWLAGHEVGFLKFLFWIVVFSIIYFGGQKVFGSAGTTGHGPSNTKIAGILGAVIATASVLIVKDEIILGAFAAYVGLVFVFIYGVVLYWLWKIAYHPSGFLVTAMAANRRSLAAARIFIIFIAMSFLAAFQYNLIFVFELVRTGLR
ncbi:MAG TPA: hypothetical protein VK158_00185 [Acidobacteriota bacterium]|nr:hypothetical protein [Acidobacteriota bacterium]